MTEVPVGHRTALAPLFSVWDQTLIRSALEGCMGNVWADSDHEPRAAMAAVTIFIFFGGDASAPGARALVEHAFTLSGKTLLDIGCPTPEWEALVREVFADEETYELSSFPRFEMLSKDVRFDEEHLRSLAVLPEGYRLVPMDRRYYDAARLPGWEGGVPWAFVSYEEFQAHGFGLVLEYHGEPVGCTVTFSYCSGCCETEIEIAAAHRGRGIGTACAAAFILECLSRGIYPGWNAANPTSRHLAEKLGYHGCRPYTNYRVQIKAK